MVLRDTTNGNIFPADRCTWAQQDDPAGGYRITNANFYPGASVDGVLGLSAPATHIAIASPVLGYIGKSGRFVAITN